MELGIINCVWRYKTGSCFKTTDFLHETREYCIKIVCTKIRLGAISKLFTMSLKRCWWELFHSRIHSFLWCFFKYSFDDNNEITQYRMGFLRYKYIVLPSWGLAQNPLRPQNFLDSGFHILSCCQSKDLQWSIQSTLHSIESDICGAEPLVL